MSVVRKYELFVNLSYVTIGDVRTFTHALLLQQDDDPTKRAGTATRCMLRGFLTDPALPTFDLVVPSFDHDLVPAPVPAWVPDGYRSGNAHLRFPGWDREILVSSDINSTLGVQTLHFADNADIDLVWKALTREVAAHWSAPRMPIKHYEDADRVRSILGVAQRGQ